MEYRQLGKSDLRVSSLGLGCVTFGREIDEAASFDILDHAWERGINLLDTADVYGAGASETVIGNWLRRRGLRDRVILATKVGGGSPTDPTDRGLKPERIRRQAEESLRRLGTDRIDLYQLHTPDPHTPLEETLEALDGLVRHGMVRHIGCSNYMAWQICLGNCTCERNGWVPLVSAQPPYNVALRDAEQELFPFCLQQQVGVLSYSPLAGGFLAGRYRRGEPVPPGKRFDVVPGYQPIYFNERSWATLERLRAKAEERGVPMQRLAMAWVVSQPAVTSVLVGARYAEQIDNAFDAEALALTPAERAELAGE